MIYSSAYTSPYFNLELTQQEKRTHITLCLLSQTITTAGIPYIYDVLQRDLPTIYSSTCYNYKHAPFNEEVLSTEIGHLFEHILLEYLCLLKISRGHEVAEYNGVTTWDWRTERKGTFHISIDVPMRDLSLLTQALEKSILLLEKIMQISYPLQSLSSETTPFVGSLESSLTHL